MRVTEKNWVTRQNSNSDFSGSFQNSLGKPDSEGGVSSDSAAAFGFFFL